MVTGSRGWTHRGKVQQVFWGMDDNYKGKITLFHGGAKGADRIAAEFAEDLGWEVIEVKADWDVHGKKAGVLRNVQMLDQNPSYVVAFWDGQSKGTKHAFGEAIKRGIATDIYVRRTQ